MAKVLYQQGEITAEELAEIVRADRRFGVAEDVYETNETRLKNRSKILGFSVSKNFMASSDHSTELENKQKSCD